MTTSVIPTRPRICIAIPAYNAARTLRATLDSIVSQDYDAWEVSAVDDGSTDDTAAILAEYAARDPRVHFVSQPNAGTGAALNTAFRNARAEFIAQFGADDELLPGYMTTMAAFMDEHPGFDIYSCNAWLVYPDGRRRRYVEELPDVQWVSMSFADYLRGSQYLFAGGALVRRELYERLGGFRPEFFAEDVDFWRRAFASGATHIFCPETLVVYKKGGAGQKSSDRRRIVESYLRTDEELLASGKLSPEEAELVRAAIAVHRARLEFGGTPEELAHQRMEQQAQALRRVVVRLVGEIRADDVLTLLHRFSRVARPMRYAANRGLEKVKQVVRRW